MLQKWWDGNSVQMDTDPKQTLKAVQGFLKAKERREEIIFVGQVNHLISTQQSVLFITKDKTEGRQAHKQERTGKASARRKLRIC